MNIRNAFACGIAAALLFLAPDLCRAQDQQSMLAVKKIVFKQDRSGKERVDILCDRACTPVLSTVDGNKPRTVMDFANVSSIDPKYRSVSVSGKHVHKIRTYLDKNTHKLRVVLDMAPAKRFAVQVKKDETAALFRLEISELPAGRRAAKDQKAGQERILIVDRTAKPEETAPAAKAAPPREAPATIAKAKEAEAAKPALQRNTTDRGRSQMNAGDYKGAIQTFTQILAENPQDSLSYRLRGNAYQNLGDRQKAVEDWIKAAQLGDPIIQSYLDHMQIDWKEAPKKE